MFLRHCNMVDVESGSLCYFRKATEREYFIIYLKILNLKVEAKNEKWNKLKTKLSNQLTW